MVTEICNMKKFAGRSRLKSHAKIQDDKLKIIYAELIHSLILSKKVHCTFQSEVNFCDFTNKN